MEDQPVIRAPEILELAVGDPFFEHVQEINDRIGRRAYELFESKGSTHGSHLEDWLCAESEILHAVPLDLTETETEFTIRAEVPGFTENDLEVRVEPHRLFITGKRQETTEQKRGKTVYSERHANLIFRVLDLPVRINPVAVKATLSNGILEITLSKLEAAKKIPVFTKAATA